MKLHLASIGLLVLTTLLYTGYNLLVRQSASFVPSTTSTITATIALQVSALAVSTVFLLLLKTTSNAALALPAGAYGWAAIAGLCIGAAEICYFYLYTGIAGEPPLSVGVVMPVIIAGSVLLGLFAAWRLFAEPMGWLQLCGGVLIAGGIALLFAGAESNA